VAAPLSGSSAEKRLRLLEASHGIGGGGRCPECGGPEDGPEGPPWLLTVISDAVTGEFCWAELDGERISEDELREIEEEACSLCEARRPTITIGGGPLP
jgi:hypothetical protein